MESINAKFAVVRRGDGYIRLFDEKNFSHDPLYEDVFENVSITFNDNRSITLEGDEQQYKFTLDDMLLSEMEDKPHPSYIKLTRFTKKEVIRRGWYRLADNIHKTLIISRYVIEKIN